MKGNLIAGDMRKPMRMQKFYLEIDVIPEQIKSILISYLKSKTKEEIISADCQIIIDGWIKNEVGK